MSGVLFVRGNGFTEPGNLLLVDSVNNAVLLGFLRIHKQVSVDVGLDFGELLTGGFGEHLV
jgi:hypothetical protein